MAVAVVAAGSGLGLIPLPFEMFELATRVPVVFRLHMLSSALALLLVPAVIMTRQTSHLHRPLGRLLGAFVVIGGLTALPVAVLSHSGAVARAGFFVQGLVWLALLGVGWQAIRRRQFTRHVMAMIAMVAVTSGAVWFRLFIGTAIALKLPFEPAYALAAWAGWIVPLALVAIYRAPIAEALRPARKCPVLDHSVRLV